GLVGIVGSGSNAAYYDGKKIASNNFGLGYILADEGSANWLGRNLLQDYITQAMPQNLLIKFAEKYPLDIKMIMERVYRHSNPILLLRSFSFIVFENREDLYMKQLITKGFNLLF